MGTEGKYCVRIWGFAEEGTGVGRHIGTSQQRAMRPEELELWALPGAGDWRARRGGVSTFISRKGVPRGWEWLLAAWRLPLAPWKCQGEVDECWGHCELSHGEQISGGLLNLLPSTSLKLPHLTWSYWGFLAVFLKAWAKLVPAIALGFRAK